MHFNILFALRLYNYPKSGKKRILLQLGNFESYLAWKSVLAAFILLMMSPTFPTTAAKTNIPSRNMDPVKRYS